MTTDEPYSDRRRVLARQWDELVDEIRSLDGFETFFEPPDVDDLLTAGDNGPVIVVNVSRWRCDALVVADGAIDVVPLADMTLEDVQRRTARHLENLVWHTATLNGIDSARREFNTSRSPAAARGVRDATEAQYQARINLNEDLADTLSWLWDVLVEPLGKYLVDRTSRVWWSPTGPLAVLPIHAAGSPSSGWLVDRVVSSYAPSLRSLIASRGAQPTGNPTGSRFGIISTLGDTDHLLGVAGPLRELVGPELLVSSGSATVAEAHRVLAECTSVHFDCHAIHNLSAPGDGGFILKDGMLRVFELARTVASRELAGLAACDTAAGGSELFNESITLATALHYSGFRHVVGALWELRDDVARTVFADLYRDLVTADGLVTAHTGAAVSRIVRALRSAKPDDPYTWASLIHLGP
ncbi:CHAT domain-containing protein [Gordonia sp. NPDC003376]